MVDDQRRSRLHRCRDGRQRQRIGPSRQGDTPTRVDDRVFATERLDGRLQRGYSTRSIHRCGSSISVGSGKVSGLDQTVLNRVMPTRDTT